MKELTVFEMESIAGGDLYSALTGAATFVFDGVRAAALAATVGATMAGAWGGRWGAAGGGLLGVGAIGQGVGLIAGLLVGGIGFGLAGPLLGWDRTYELASGTIGAIVDGTLDFWGYNS